MRLVVFFVLNLVAIQLILSQAYENGNLVVYCELNFAILLCYVNQLIILVVSFEPASLELEKGTIRNVTVKLK